MEMHSLRVVENSGIKDLRFYQILENMASVRQLRVISGLCFFSLAYDLESTYVRKRSRDAEFRRSRSDAAGDDQHHVLIQVPVMPVDLADEPCYCRLIYVRHVVIIYGVHIYDDVEFGCLRKAHRRRPVFEQDVILRNTFGYYRSA